MLLRSSSGLSCVKIVETYYFFLNFKMSGINTWPIGQIYTFFCPVQLEATFLTTKYLKKRTKKYLSI